MEVERGGDERYEVYWGGFFSPLTSNESSGKQGGSGKKDNKRG